jgi:predicted NAD/FAD-binding protein
VERIAVIGSGIAGLAAARSLSLGPLATHVTLFEADRRAGGHAHTVDVTLNGATHGVDTGFLVYNELNYPRLCALFDELGVETVPSDMSFSVQVRDVATGQALEWSGSSVAALFAQRRNALRPGFWRMLADLLRFNRLATALARLDSEALLAGAGREAALDEPVGVFLDRHRFSADFRDGYLLPMVACIWSCPTQQMLSFPMATLIRFCHNHGLLQIAGRPQWRTVRGGSRQYVRRVVAALPDVRLATPVRAVLRHDAGIRIVTDGATEHFDQVVFACHTDQTLALLGSGATEGEQRVLGAIRYQRNRALLHLDASLLPTRRAAWAAWNYESGGAADGVCLHYLINRLQPLPWQQPVIVSLNPVREPDPAQVLQRFEVAHPVFDQAAIAGQRELPGLQGQRRSWFCGAWTGYGFHEDGLASGQHVAKAIGARALPVLEGAA